LDRSAALDQAGETGLRDLVDNHYARIFGMSLAVGALSGLTQYNTSYGLEVSSSDVYRQGISRSLGDSSTRIMDKFMNVLPTFTIREGHRVKIYLLSDLDLPAYDPEKGAMQ
jgi:type IV secretion system protein VirB10